MEKQVLITGASQGIGRALVKAFITKSEYHIWAVARNEEALQQLAAECLAVTGRTLHVLACDITQASSRQMIRDRIGEKGTLDILVNNAGILINKPFLETSSDEIRQQMLVNVEVPYLLSAMLISLMPPRAHIVNISSMGGFQGSSKFPGLSAYSASKAALNVLTECMAVELAEKKIAVNSLSLGSVQTDMLEQAFPGYKAPVDSDEIAEWICDFCRYGAKFFNGKILPVSTNTP